MVSQDFEFDAFFPSILSRLYQPIVQTYNVLKEIQVHFISRNKAGKSKTIFRGNMAIKA